MKGCTVTIRHPAQNTIIVLSATPSEEINEKIHTNVRAASHNVCIESRRSPADFLLDYGQSPFDNERVQSDKFSLRQSGTVTGRKELWLPALY